MVKIMDSGVLTFFSSAKQDILLFVYLNIELSVKSFL
jgi:hypothetical protein